MTDAIEKGNQLWNELRQFTGGDTVYHHALAKTFHYTAGVREFARQAGAYWLLDILATEPAIAKHVKNEGFGLVLLKVDGSKAELTVADDSDVPPIFSRHIDLTDCPPAPKNDRNTEGAWKFYLEMTMVGERVVPICMLPQER